MKRSVPYVAQENKTDCGIACLLAIIQFYGNTVPRNWLYQESDYEKAGVSMYGLAKAANKLGFKVEGKQCELSYLDKLKTPFIAHTKLNDDNTFYHFIVVVEVGKSKVTIMDPAMGHQKLSLEQFEKIATSNYLLLYPTSNLKSITLSQTIDYLKKEFFKKQKKSIVVFIILIFFEIWLEIVTLFQFKILINIALFPSSISNAIRLTFLFFELLILRCMTNYLTMQYQLFWEKQITSQLKNKFFAQFVTLPLQYYQMRDSGIILSLIDDIEVISQFQSKSIYYVLYHFFFLIFLYLYMLYLSIEMSCIIFSSHFLFTMITIYERKKQKQIYKEFYEEKTKKHRLFTLLLHSVEMIKGLHLEHKYSKNLYQQEQCFLSKQEKLKKRKNKQQIVFSFWENCIYLFVIATSVCLFIQGKLSMSLSNFLLLEGFITSILRNYNTLLLWYLEYEIYCEAKKRINEFFYCQPEKLLFHSQLEIRKEIKVVDIKNLSFSYRDRIILNQCSLQIKAADKIFLFGNSGSGKSTFLKLLGRYYPVPYGKIYFNDIDILHYNLESLRRVITYITPQINIMAASLKNVILLQRKLDEKRLKEILIACGITDMFEEKGYSLEMMIEENASNLSCGERARVILAQGLYQKSQIYLLDECLSMVDINLEKKIIKRLCKLYSQQIIVYVSHRLELKHLFNRNVFIKEGKCHEEKR